MQTQELVKRKVKSEFEKMLNVGPATAADLARLGVTSIEQLKSCNAQELYDRISAMDGVKHDICVLDVFTAIIENAKRNEQRSWWDYTKLRKEAADKERVPGEIG